MEKRKAKQSGLEFSVLGAGCWAFGGGEYWGDQSQKDINEVVPASVDLGINYFDTAEAYNEGRSESSLGEAIRGLPRDRFLIGTKISPSNCYKDTLVTHCNDSLKRLGTDYIDVYMLHWPIHPHSIRHFTEDEAVIRNPPSIGEAMQTLLELRAAGKIRHIGVSNFSKELLLDLPVTEIAVNELPYNLFCRAGEFDILSASYSRGIGVIGYMTLLQGILANIYPTLDDVPVWQRRSRHFSAKRTKECRHGEDGAEEEVNEALVSLRRLSGELGMTMADLAIKWILANPAITCALVGSRNIRELEENIKALDNPLSADVKNELDRITAPIKQKLGNHLDFYESAENDRTLKPRSPVLH